VHPRILLELELEEVVADVVIPKAASDVSGGMAVKTKSKG